MPKTTKTTGLTSEQVAFYGLEKFVTPIDKPKKAKKAKKTGHVASYPGKFPLLTEDDLAAIDGMGGEFDWGKLGSFSGWSRGRKSDPADKAQTLPKAPAPAAYSLLDRAKGALAGLAAGDAIGAQVEFRIRGSFPDQKDMVGGGPFDLKAGQWTDDTIMAMCLAESLVKCGEFNPDDQLTRYTWWRDKGYMSPKGYCFDIGGATSRALMEYRQTREPYRAPSQSAAGNGSLMRLAPVPIRYHKSMAAALQFASWQSMTTHHHPEAIGACRYMTALVVLALRGADKAQLLKPYAGLDPKTLQLPEDTAMVAAGSWSVTPREGIRSGGYAVDSLEAAIWCFANTDSYRDCVLAAVNLGRDADTTGAIAGMLAGAFYGYEAIPTKWRQKLHNHDLITEYASALALAD